MQFTLAVVLEHWADTDEMVLFVLLSFSPFGRGRGFFNVLRFSFLG